MRGEFLFLGTGASAGIPMIGCHCRVCTSTNPHNKRLRPSGLITIDKKNILIDTGPDLRYQALRYHIETLDGVLYTHSHFDHVAGLDELRSFYLMKRMVVPVVVSKTTFEDFKIRYAYLFREKSWGRSLAAQLEFHLLEKERGESIFLGIPFRYMTYSQIGMEVTGYKIGNFAYVSDIKEYPSSIFEDLAGCETLVLSALRQEDSAAHLSITEAIAFAKRVGAKEVWFTHMAHELEHEETNRSLPPGFQLAHDGLKIEFEV